MIQSNKNPLNLEFEVTDNSVPVGFKSKIINGVVPHEALQLAKKMIHVCEELGEVVEQETKKVKNNDTDSVEPIITRKLELTSAYLETAINLRQCSLGELPEDHATQLRQAVSKLQTRMASNQIVLAAARAAVNGIMKAIHERMSQKSGASNLYGAQGQSQYVAAHNTTPIAINCRF